MPIYNINRSNIGVSVYVNGSPFFLAFIIVLSNFKGRVLRLERWASLSNLVCFLEGNLPMVVPPWLVCCPIFFS